MGRGLSDQLVTRFSFHVDVAYVLYTPVNHYMTVFQRWVFLDLKSSDASISRLVSGRCPSGQRELV